MLNKSIFKSLETAGFIAYDMLIVLAKISKKVLYDDF